ncbi:MAG: zinc ribbon domain-containing protein [Clostridia bacterium]|nr:zinc ribbon domain-containing protein [Clostridia bacterium]
MPLYEFRCPQCGCRFELLCSISQRDNAVCPKCAGKVERVYQGKCAFGAIKGASGCGGNCSGCPGCGSRT